LRTLSTSVLPEIWPGFHDEHGDRERKCQCADEETKADLTDASNPILPRSPESCGADGQEKQDCRNQPRRETTWSHRNHSIL
jgi:hypothetical protein